MTSDIICIGRRTIQVQTLAREVTAQIEILCDSVGFSYGEKPTGYDVLTSVALGYFRRLKYYVETISCN